MATLFLIAVLHCAVASSPQPVPTVVTADPPADANFPARTEVIHVPSGAVQINGVVYVASGQSPHPAFVIAGLGVLPVTFDSRKPWRVRSRRSHSSGLPITPSASLPM